jgi:hypothetical protein
MAARLIVALEAEQDIAEAFAWYEDQRAGLGEDFLGRVDACIQATLRNPEIHAIVHESYRRALVRRFPFATRLLIQTRHPRTIDAKENQMSPRGGRAPTHPICRATNAISPAGPRSLC